MSQKKAGRPTTNPKTSPIHVRLDSETEHILKEYCKQYNIPKAKAVREGIKKLKDDIKK